MPATHLTLKWIDPEHWARDGTNWATELNDLWLRARHQTRKPDQWEKCHTRATASLMIRDDNRVVAYGRYVYDGEDITIHDLAVDPDYRSQELDQTIVNTLLRDAQRHDANFALLINHEGAGVVNEGLGFTPLPHCGPQVLHARLR